LLRGLVVSSMYARMRAQSWGETRLPATMLGSVGSCDFAC
jgi:hypothetical protein